MSDVAKAVTACGEAAREGARSLAAARDEAIDEALRGMAALLGDAAGRVLAANAADVASGEEAGLGKGLLDRLRLDGARITEMARQIGLLAGLPFPPEQVGVRDLPGGLRLAERRVPVGVIGANYEARPNVTVDVASQLLKSRNAGVLRTGGAALRSAAALFDHVITPAVAAAGLDPGALQLVRSADREAATELVRQPALIPLVILRGSGATTRALAAEAARHGVRTLAHADGGGVLYLDAAADPAMAAQIITGSVDRLGVCNRLNLLLVHEAAWDALLPVALDGAGGLRDRRVAAAPWPPARPRMGTRRGARGDRDGGPGRGPRPGRAGRQRADARAGGRAWSPPTPRRRARSWPPTPGPARSGTPAPGCSTGSSSAACRRPASTSITCPGRAAR